MKPCLLPFILYYIPLFRLLRFNAHPVFLSSSFIDSLKHPTNNSFYAKKKEQIEMILNDFIFIPFV